MSVMPEVLKMLKEYRFDDAIPLVSLMLREAAAESPERLLEAAREVVAWKGIFGHARQAVASEPYFRAVYATLGELAGPDSPPAMAAAENLAGILGSIDRIDEAIALRERVFSHVAGRFPMDDPRFLGVRDGLGFLYSRAGREDKWEEIYRHVGLCGHLTPAEQYIRERGAKVVSCCRPWSRNCHIWVYFDVLLDCESLMRGLALDAAVEIHDHRGTHDGSERGLVCSVHGDGVIGPHPSDALPGTRTVSHLESSDKRL